MSLSLVQVNPKSPELEGKHKSTAQLLHVTVTNVRAQLEQAAILSILKFTDQLNDRLAQLAPPDE